jgi:hypothetical protein
MIQKRVGDEPPRLAEQRHRMAPHRAGNPKQLQTTGRSCSAMPDTLT